MVDLAVNIWADCPQTCLPAFMFRFAGQVAEGTRHHQSPLVPPKPSQRCFVSYLLLGSSRAGMVVETKRMARSLRERCMKYIQVSGVLYHAVPTSCMFFVLSLFPLLWQFFRFTFILVPCRSSTRGER